MKVELTKVTKVGAEAKVLKIHAKCSDCCTARLYDADGAMLADHDGYVPDIMPGEHYGDDIILDIDIDTGTILNWKKPSAEAVEAFIEENNAPDSE